MRVDIEDVRKHMEFRKKINNNVKLKDIEFYENGKKLDISEELKDDFIFTGLSNIDFITMECYKEKPQKD